VIFCAVIATWCCEVGGRVSCFFELGSMLFAWEGFKLFPFPRVLAGCRGPFSGGLVFRFFVLSVIRFLGASVWLFAGGCWRLARWVCFCYGSVLPGGASVAWSWDFEAGLCFFSSVVLYRFEVCVLCAWAAGLTACRILVLAASVGIGGVCGVATCLCVSILFFVFF